MKLFDNSEKEECVVYGLVDAKRPHKIKYVGATTRTFSERLAEHRRIKSSSGGLPLRTWANRVREGGGQIDLVVLESMPSRRGLKKAEQQWIAWAKLFGPTLNNELGDLNGKNRFNKEFVE